MEASPLSCAERESPMSQKFIARLTLSLVLLVLPVAGMTPARHHEPTGVAEGFLRGALEFLAENLREQVGNCVGGDADPSPPERAAKVLWRN